MRTTLVAGIPTTNAALYRRIRFLAGDPAAIIDWPEGRSPRSTLIIRAIEMERAKQHARAGEVRCPEDFPPSGGLSGDRETSTAQGVAECLRRAGTTQVRAHKSTPLIFTHHLREAGIEVVYDPDLFSREQRSKDEQELAWLREAQGVTEEAMRMACELVARATPDRVGTLMRDGAPLTSERVRTEIDLFLLKRGYSNPTSIVAGGPQGADCHDCGSGALRTGEPVIIDIFPRSKQTLYNGDCTRTVVHCEIPDEVARMHAAVVEAKAAAIAAMHPGATGHTVHTATTAVITGHGYHMGLPPDDAPATYTSMVHGTGHGIGLEGHEPPLLDTNGLPLVIGDVVTIEPGLYFKAIGGVRIEDMVVVTEGGNENFDALPEGLSWR
jgi:Xaa-Pro aminopeptidase